MKVHLFYFCLPQWHFCSRSSLDLIVCFIFQTWARKHRTDEEGQKWITQVGASRMPPPHFLHLTPLLSRPSRLMIGALLDDLCAGRRSRRERCRAAEFDLHRMELINILRTLRPPRSLSVYHTCFLAASGRMATIYRRTTDRFKDRYTAKRETKGWGLRWDGGRAEGGREAEKLVENDDVVLFIYFICRINTQRRVTAVTKQNIAEIN